MTAIIFDCDGVIVDSEVLLIDLEIQELKEIGLDYDVLGFKKRFLGVTGKDFVQNVKDDYFEKFNTDLQDNGFFDSRYTKAVELLKQELKPVLGIKDVVQNISCPTAIASSSEFIWLQEKLRITGLFDRFTPHIYSGDFVKNGKPAPDLFLYSAEKLNVAPKDCIVIEDSANGVRAAKSAGMIAYGFLGGGHCDDDHAEFLMNAGADKIIKTSDELHLILKDVV